MRQPEEMARSRYGATAFDPRIGMRSWHASRLRKTGVSLYQMGAAAGAADLARRLRKTGVSLYQIVVQHVKR
jgi:hypothetical protein